MSRRERLREATVREIKDLARQQLAEHGPPGVSLRGIARAMGMTSAAVYRYFPSHDELLTALATDLYEEVTAVMAEARDAAGADQPPVHRLKAVCRAFRTWSITHRPEFEVLFNHPLTAFAGVPSGPAHEAAARFGGTFFALFAEIWQRQPFPVTPDDELPPDLADQLAAYREKVRGQLPLGAIQVFLHGWVRLYGVVSLEVFHHLNFVAEDVTPLFESLLEELTQVLDAGADGRP